jgi:proteasome lid subunit RPN8/RPN11
LLGGVYRTLDTAHLLDYHFDFVEVMGSIPAQHTDATRGSLRFTHEAWAEMNRVRDHRYPDMEIVGWYHTHPGQGIFLSPDDLNIHNNHFSDAFKLALVVETHLHRGAFFVDTDKSGGPFPSQEFGWDVRLLGAVEPTPGARVDVQHPPRVDARSAQRAPQEVLEISEHDLPPDAVEPERHWDTGPLSIGRDDPEPVTGAAMRVVRTRWFEAGYFCLVLAVVSVSAFVAVQDWHRRWPALVLVCVVTLVASMILVSLRAPTRR